MVLTLMRHGIAESWTGSDASRSLTPQGSEIVHEVVKGLEAGGWSPGAVVCSPLLRSQQTAAIVLEHFPGLQHEVLSQVVHTDDDLFDEMSWLGVVDPVIVGHNPGLSRLAAQLIGARGHMPFEPATVACYRVDGLPPRSPAQLMFFAPPTFARCLR